MFDQSYWPMYVTIAAILVLGLSLSIGLYVQQGRQTQRDAAHAAEVMAAVRSMAVVNRRLAQPDVAARPAKPAVPVPRVATPKI